MLSNNFLLQNKCFNYQYAWIVYVFPFTISGQTYLLIIIEQFYPYIHFYDFESTLFSVFPTCLKVVYRGFESCLVVAITSIIKRQMVVKWFEDWCNDGLAQCRHILYSEIMLYKTLWYIVDTHGVKYNSRV